MDCVNETDERMHPRKRRLKTVFAVGIKPKPHGRSMDGMKQVSAVGE
jgi:hypothetical protein